MLSNRISAGLSSCGWFNQARPTGAYPRLFICFPGVLGHVPKSVGKAESVRGGRAMLTQSGSCGS